MPHPGIAILEAIISEEETTLADMQAQYQALVSAEGSGRRYLKFSFQATECLARARDARLVIRLAGIAMVTLME